MRELIQTNNDLCTGCNRCVRKCPMEMANITYQDDEGKVKVKINDEKCVICGRCVSACKHNARYYTDDTARFFDDLQNGEPISLIAAPAVRTNFPDWKRLFTWLKKLGVRKIYDASIGADICTWAHIRYIQQHESARLITQPCPAIVTYCEAYRPDLLDNLSPVQSPMACVSIYMKEYEGISDSIAALSPCIAKSNEFADTGLSQYNVTFTKLMEYINENDIKLPKKETGFDHYESGLGSLFPMPGGLKENIEFFTDKELSIDKSEGYDVFERLNIYAESPAEKLPRIFDVLNCREGCNIGTACSQSTNVFEIYRAMDGGRSTAIENRKKEYFNELHNKYDETLDLSRFMREYRPIAAPFTEITDEDIELAFFSLNKNDYEKKTVDCGACGSDTCLGMARKIALGVNIPINCIIKTMEDAKAEHDINLNALTQVAAMEKMHEADERMRIMLDKTPIGACFWDEDMKMLDCNQEMVRLFSLSSKQEYMERFLELSPEYQPDGRLSAEVIEFNNKKAFEEGFFRYEWMHRSLDDEEIPVEVTLVCVDYKGNRLVAAYVRDLREQKRMLNEIDATAAKLQSALDEAEKAVNALETAQSTTTAMLASNPQINILFDSKFKAVECNPSASQFMGFDTKEETLEYFLDFLSRNMPTFKSDGLPSVSVGEKLVAASVDGYAKFVAEVNINGTTRTLNVEFIKIPYEKSFGIVAYVIDMTDIHERELELTRAHEMNVFQLTKLDIAVKASKIGLWDMEFDKDNPVHSDNAFMWSDEFRHMLGFSDETDFPNILSSWSDRLHPDDKERTLNAFRAHLLDTTGQTPYDIEYRLKKKNGDYAFYRASGETIRDENGNALRVAGALADITETKNILLDTERQRLEAEAANQAKSAFLSTMSHEIRTPMNAILGITEIQLQNDSLDKDVRDGFEKIYISGDMLLGIINDILDLSKIEAGKLELIIANYQIASLISDTAQLNMMRIGSKPIEFELQIDENLPATLVGDELRVKQIFNNLLSNAFKYSDKGTVTLRVSGEKGDTDDEIKLIVDVIDMGQGMTKEQIKRLFDEYSQFNKEANRTTEGTGLGMGIARNLIRMMRGEIFIESEPGKGSKFTVHIPQGKVGVELLGKEMADNLHRFRTSSKAQMRRIQITRDPMPYGNVLIVDDVETNIFVAKGLLSPYELRIDAADSGFGAIERIKNGNVYDIVFMDHMMPKMDGIEATKILREMGYDKPVVALTANAVSGQADLFLANGFDGFLSKPIDIRQLNNVLNKLIRDKQPPEVVEEVRRQAKTKISRPPADERESGISPQLAEIFVRDANKSLAVLDAFIEKGAPYSEEDIRTYVIHTHGMKSVLANIGKMDLSAVALKLEQLGRDDNIEVISAETPAFLDSLRAMVAEMKPKDEAGGAETADEDEDKAFLNEKLLAVKAACDDYDTNAVDEAITELKELPWSQATRDLFGKISEFVLHGDFEVAIDAVEKFMEAK